MKLRQLLPASLLALTAVGAQGVPAVPGLITTRQPDGTSISINLYGDETFSWARSADGYTLLRDAQGYWTVARPEPSGKLVASDMRLTGTSAAAQAARIGVNPMLPMTIETANALRRAPQRAAVSNLQVDATFPTTGKRKLLMLLVNFADTRTTYSRTDFDNFMNQKGYKGIGSFRDFYLENSYGQFDIETTVTEWITLPSDKREYNADNVANMIKWALTLVAQEMDITQFDNDGDGILDGLAIIHQGPGGEATGSSADIWSHSSIIYGLEVGGLEVRRYTIQPETFGNTGKMSEIGVMCHEFGHNLGAPDFYDTDYSGSGGEYCGTGVWDLLGSGAWNGPDDAKGSRPPHVNMWQKIQFGWVTPEILSDSKSIAAMPDATNSPAAYRFDTTAANDYFIIENRQASGEFNSALPGHGLIITHANDKIISTNVMANTINATYPQGCYTVAANATTDPGVETYSYGYLQLPTAPFPSEGKNEFTDTSVPSCRAVDGRWAYKGLKNITEAADGSISFDFVATDVPASPSDLQAASEGADVRLSWNAPAGAAPVGYNIYRNTKLIDFVTETSYLDPAPEATGRIEYMVDAKYADDRVSPPVEIAIRVPAPKVTKLTGTTHEDAVQLSWELEPNISRIQNPGNVPGDFQISDVRGETIEFGHRFTAADLVTYVGTKIRRVSFIPYQSLQEAKYVINIYEADADDSNPQVVSSREVKEMGTGIWNSILLTKAVEIKADHEYLITIEATPTVKVAQLLTEPSDMLDGFGNILRINGGDWTTNADGAGNFFIYAITADAASEQAAPVANDDSEIDPDIDLYFPVGFRVYRDGQLIGETSTRTFFESPRPGGEHSYTVTTLYKGNSETAPCEAVKVDSGVVGIQSVGTTTEEQPLYRLDGTRVPAGTTAKGLYLRKGEKILK